MKRLLLVSAVLAALPFAAQAESALSSAATGAMTASAKLDFIVTIPKVLYLQVGTGSTGPMASNATVNDLTFAVPAGSIGSGSVASTGGDLSAGAAVTVRVFGNTGDVSLTNATTGALSNGVAGDPTIPWTSFTVTPASLATATPGYSTTSIPHPTIVSGASSTAITLNATSKVVRREGSWTFAYNNATVMPPGTYGGTAAGRNGIVTYTATAP